MPHSSTWTRFATAAVTALALVATAITVSAGPAGAAPAGPAGAGPAPQGVGAASRDNGRIEVAERTSAGTVRIRGVQAGTWGPWLDLGGHTRFDPDVSAWGNDRVDVFAIGLDGGLWHRAQNGSSWGAWESLGGRSTSAPAAVSWGRNRIDVFTRGTSGAVWGRSFNGSAWGAWYGIGGYIVGAPTVASWGPNRLDVFAIGSDQQLWHRGFGGGWFGWEGLGGVLTASPGATSWGPNRIDIAARGADGSVWAMYWSGSRWSSWYGLGGLTVGAPELASSSANSLDLISRGMDGELHSRTFNSSFWTGWAAVPEVHQTGHQGVYVEDARLPAPAAGFPNSRIGQANYQPFYSDSVGAFRTNCHLSHMNYDDPIVFPGQVNATHLHAFFGNTGVNAFSTAESVRTTGNSTCSGGIENRSAYWAPAMIDTSTNSPVLPWGDDGLQVYYKTGYRGVPSATVQNFPAGLRIIAGDSRRTSASPVPIYDSAVVYSCLSHVGGRQQYMVQCAPGDQLIMSVMFPQCWDGVNLDSPNHQSHMAYGTPYGLPNSGCPASHPRPLPEITMNMRYLVPAGGMSSWRLSSDTYAGPAGYSGHADWWNGWRAPTFQRIVNNCYAHGLDCQMNLLGDGQALN